LLRGEVIALHSANKMKGAQFYMECAQLNVSGGGNAKPPTVAIPGAYKQNDPGVLYNVRVLFLVMFWEGGEECLLTLG
jgi:hypothetical protein